MRGRSIIFVLLWLAAPLLAQDSTIVFQPHMAKQKISRHIYGHFSEHLGRCIYGGFWVDESSGIPNAQRLRTDVIEALKEIGIPNLRWPGGCFADEYHWRDGVGPPERRPVMINTHWGGKSEDNSFGTHEFLRLCRLLNCEPVICGNVGSGTVREMSQWIEYLNSDIISPMTLLRKENGRDTSFGVRYWGIGNENWGCGGNMTAEYYADVLRRFSVYCRNHGRNKLYKIACGPYGDDTHWTEVLMKKARGSFHGLSLHYYIFTKTPALTFKESDWFTTMSKALELDRIIGKHRAIMDRYDPKGTRELIVDEWGCWHRSEPGTMLYQQNSLQDALVAAITLDILNNHCERVKMANIAQTVNVLQSVLLTRGSRLVRTPTFYIFKMYAVHHDAVLIPHEMVSVKYSLAGKSIPAIHTSASSDGKGIIHVTLTNLDPARKRRVQCIFQDIRSVRVLDGSIVTGKRMQSNNDFGRPAQVTIQRFKGFRAKNNRIVIDIPGKSVVMVACKSVR